MSALCSSVLCFSKFSSESRIRLQNSQGSLGAGGAGGGGEGVGTVLGVAVGVGGVGGGDGCWAVLVDFLSLSTGFDKMTSGSFLAVNYHTFFLSDIYRA